MLKNTFLHISGLGIRSGAKNLVLRRTLHGRTSWGKTLPSFFSAKWGDTLSGECIEESLEQISWGTTKLLRQPPTFQPILEDFSGLQRVNGLPRHRDYRGLDFWLQ